MKTVGIIGGIGPESTLDYYRRLFSQFRDQDPDGNYPEIVIDSVNLKKALDCLHENRIDDLAEYFLQSLLNLKAAGADFGIISSNTGHIVYDAIIDRAPFPMISIIEVTLGRARQLGLKRLALFGTRFTMNGHFYPAVFDESEVTLVLPQPTEQDFIHDKYLGELVNGVFLDETRKGMVRIARRMQVEEGVDGLVLGGTELPLILSQSDIPELSVLDTTQIHVDETIKALNE